VRSIGLLALLVGTAPLVTPASAQRPVAPFKAGDRYFFVGSDSALYVRDNATAPARQLLPAGTFATVAPSPNGDYLAYAVPDTGRAFQVRIRDVRTVRDINEIIPHARITRQPWTRNNKGFLYVRVDTADHHERIYYHRMGDAPTRDAVIYSRFDEPDWSYDVRVSDDGQFGIITVYHTIDTFNRLYFIDFDNPGKPTLNAPVVKFIDEFSTHTTFVDNGGNAFFLLTDRGAPLKALVTANSEVTRASDWHTVVGQSADTLAMVRTAGQQYVITVSRGTGPSTARVYAPPSDREVRQQYQKYLDSMRVADRANRGMGGPPRGPMRDYPMFRLGLKYQIPSPAGSVILDMTSNADDDELFYTVRLPDGALQSFMYNVKNQRNTPFNTTVTTPAQPVTAGK
jgi:hypothetical protein